MGYSTLVQQLVDLESLRPGDTVTVTGVNDEGVTSACALVALNITSATECKRYKPIIDDNGVRIGERCWNKFTMDYTPVTTRYFMHSSMHRGWGHVRTSLTAEVGQRFFNGLEWVRVTALTSVL